MMNSRTDQGKRLRPLIISILAVTFSVSYGSAEAGDSGQPITDLGMITQEKAYRDGELLVKFKKGVLEEEKKSKHNRNRGKRHKHFKHIDVEHVKLEPGVSVEEAAAQYKTDPDVEYAEPNYMMHALVIPNDPYFNEVWGLDNIGQSGGTSGADIGAVSAWDITTGSSDVVVAVVDSGIDVAHEDIIQNLWVNAGEVPNNGLDDDGNGYADDVHGINAVTGDGNPTDDHGHGTHCAGTIGAAGNNGIGITGVNWNVKIMACKFMGAAGGGGAADAIECLEYVRTMKNRGVNVVATSNSWGGGAYSRALYDAIQMQMTSGILFIAAAANDGSDNDAAAVYPACYDMPNIVAVAATASSDALATFSNFGRYTVHVAAPGVDVVSLRAAGTDMYTGGTHFVPPGDPSATCYRSSGTSMATPYVCGLAALVKAADPNRDWKSIKNLILSGGDSVASLNGVTVTGKRINAYGSLTCLDRPAFSILKRPRQIQAGVPVTLSALSINCGRSVGPVSVTTSTGTVALRDDGFSPDLAPGDGIYTGSWTPSGANEYLSFSSPAGTESVSVSPSLL